MILTDNFLVLFLGNNIVFHLEEVEFLAIIEKSARLIEVEDISFQSPAEEGDPFNFNLSTKVYYY